MRNRFPSFDNSFFTFVVWLGIIILILAFSFAMFTFSYWLITLILAGFFGFTLPFSGGYAFGAWLIMLVLGFFALPWKLLQFNSN